MCKKLLVFLLCTVMVFSMVACSENTKAFQVADAGNITVWIPTHCGTKYHSNPRCSNMKNPKQATLTEALSAGFEECRTCH